MLERCKNNQERWGGVHRLIDHWLDQRRQLITLYVHLEQPSKQVSERIELKVMAFCDHLVDYLSEGHFEIYEQLLKEAQAFNDGTERILVQLLPSIERSTQAMLDFQDRYACQEYDEATASSLHQALSDLGERLEDRFELEDRLIAEIHHVHSADSQQPIAELS